MKKYPHLLLFCIVLLASILRFYSLGTIPVGLHGDEASIGYNAYSLLKTAKDQDGNFLPLAFDQFGNFRAAGYHYIDVPFVALFGLNALAVRIPAALFGSLTVIVFYLLLLKLFENKTIALLGSFLLAILPWHINLSRASSEGIVSSFFVLLGVYILYTGIKQKTFSLKIFSLSLLSLMTSFFFYHAASPFVMIFLPFLFLLGFLTYSPTKVKIIGSIILYIALVFGLFFFLTVGKGTGRASQVSLLNIPGGTKEVKQSMDEDGTQNPLLTRFFHNKLYFYSRLFVTFYSQHISGDFLFVNNGSPVRYKMPWTGNLYLIQMPFLILGFAILLSEGIKGKKYLYLIPVVWLLAGAIPAALTWEDLPNVLRSNLMIPALMMMVTLGFYEAIQITKSDVRKILMIICAVILFQNMMLFLHNYFYHAKIHEPWYRSAAEEEVVFTAAALSKQYKEVVMTTERNNNFIFHLFYLKFDPATFQKMGSPKEAHNLQFGKLLFKYGPCPIREYPLEKVDIIKERAFIVMSSECEIPEQMEVTKTINTPDGSAAFRVIRLRQL